MQPTSAKWAPACRKNHRLRTRSTLLSPRGRLSFDIAWEDEGTVFVAEVKSLTTENEEKQLRSGLGQVLGHAHQIGGGDDALGSTRR